MKTKTFRFKGGPAIIGLGLFLTLAVPSRASDLVYFFSDVYGGTAPASTNLPWLSAGVKDISPGTVLLTMTNLNLMATENVDLYYFNANPAVVGSLKATVVGGSGGFDAPKIQIGEDKFKAGGDGRYDIQLSFSSGGTANNRFTSGEYALIEIQGSPTLTASDFAFMSSPVGGSTPFYASAHVQRINGTTSGWVNATQVRVVPVPEPSVAALGLLAVAGMTCCLRRTR